PSSLPEGLRVATKRHPTDGEWEALRFAWRVCAHVKSNAVIFTDASRTLAIGAGQMSRVDAVHVAAAKARAANVSLTGSAAASDASGSALVIYDRWSGRFQRGVYDADGKVKAMQVFTPF